MILSQQFAQVKVEAGVEPCGAGIFADLHAEHTINNNGHTSVSSPASSVADLSTLAALEISKP